MGDLTGQTLNNVSIRDDGQFLVLELSGTEVVAEAMGDCCSHSWIENVEHPARGYPAVIQEVKGLALDLPETVGDEYYLQYYGLEIVTDKGSIVIDYRNSSNGYYGGWLEWPTGVDL